MKDLKQVYQLTTDLWKLMKKTINNTKSDEEWEYVIAEAGRISHAYPDLQPLPDNLLVGYLNALEAYKGEKE